MNLLGLCLTSCRVFVYELTDPTTCFAWCPLPAKYGYLVTTVWSGGYCFGDMELSDV